MVIENRVTGEESTEALSATATVGETPPRFSCYVYSDSDVSVEGAYWRKTGSNREFTQIQAPFSSTITWDEYLSYSDGGQYECQVAGLATPNPRTLTLVLNRTYYNKILLGASAIQWSSIWLNKRSE